MQDAIEFLYLFARHEPADAFLILVLGGIVAAVVVNEWRDRR